MRTLENIGLAIICAQALCAALYVLAVLSDWMIDRVARALKLHRAFRLFLCGPYFQEMKRQSREEEEKTNAD